MAEFIPRTYDQILADMVAHVQNYSEISDFSEGSVERTLLEAAALEDDEAYFQMTQILEIISIFTAKGDKLDRRLADYGIARKVAKSATGRGRYFDRNLIQDRVAVDAGVGDTTVYAFSTSVFPISGYPYTIRIAEDSTRVQDVVVSFNNTTTNSLSISTPLSYELVAGDRIALVTGASARTINSGVQVVCKATSSSAAKVYTSQQQAFIDAGNYFSNQVIFKATTVGSSGNVAAGRVTEFLGSPPFTGASVISTTAMAGGSDQEIDSALLERAIDKIKGLSRGVRSALKAAAKEVEDSTTGQRVLSANIIEDFANDEVIVYIDDGSGFTPDYISYPTSTLASSVVASSSITVVDGTFFTTAGHLLIDSGSSSSVVGYTTRTGNVFTLDQTVTYPSGSSVYFVEYVTQSTKLQQLRFKLRHFPVVRNTDILWVFRPTDSRWTQLTRGLDYIVNKGTGDLVLKQALPINTKIAAQYSYYINLVASVQKVLEGDPNDEANFPGVKAAGIMLAVEAPAFRRITVRLSIVAKPGFTETDLYDSVRSAVEQYISSLKLGDDVIWSEIVAAAQGIIGVLSVKVLEPTGDRTILENELPLPFDAAGNSLISVI